MDFHSLKRKELQALCKKHGIPANLTNREMADRLSSNFKENNSSENSSTSPVEICCENEAKVAKKQLKKVRFSSESANQTFEYQVSVYPKPKRATRQTLSNPAQVLENAAESEVIKKLEGCQLRVTRSRVQNAVKEDINTASSPPAGRKRGRGGKESKDAKEVDDICESESLELGTKDVKNDIGGLCGRQLRSRRHVTQGEAKKLRNGIGGDQVHLLLDESSESTNVPKQQSTRNIEVVSRVTRKSRALSKDVASMVNNDVKIVEVKEGCEAEKPQRRSKRSSEKACAKSATSAKSETEVTKVQERSERDIELVEPPECLRRYRSRRNSVVSQRSTEENKEELLKEESKKRSRTTELDAIVEDSSEVERVKCAVTSQHHASSRRGRRKTAILTAPASELANKEGVAVTSQHQIPSRRGRRKTVILTAPASELENQEDIGNGTTEKQRKSSRNSSQYSLCGTSKEYPIAVSRNDQRFKNQTQEPILEEEKTSAREHQPPTQKPQRRSSCNTSISATVAPPTPTGRDVEKEQQSKSTMAIVEEEAAPTDNLPSPGDLPTGKDVLVAVSERAGNEYYLDVDVSKQVVKNGDTCSNKSRKGLRKNSEAEKQRGFAESSPLFLKMEECKDSSRNLEENLIASCVKLVGPSTDLEVKQSGHGSVAVCEKESNFVEDAIEKLVPGGNIDSEVSCMSSQTVNTTCVLDVANFSDPKRLKFESYSSHRVVSSQITFPYGSHGKGVPDQETKEDMKVMDVHSAHESLIVYKEKTTLVERENEMVIQVDAAGSEMNHHSSSWSLQQRAAVSDSNRVKSRQVERESNVINMDEINCQADGISDQETKEDMKLMDTHSAHESLIVYKKDTTLVEREKEMVVQVDAAGSEMNHHSSSWSLQQRAAVSDSNRVKSRQVELESNVINMDEITCQADGISDQRDLTGATSTFLQSEEELGTELAGGENTNFASDNVSAADRTPSAEPRVGVELKDTEVTAAASVKGKVLNLNKFGEISGFKIELENPLKKAEEIIATDASKEGLPQIQSSVEASENQESAAKSHFATVDIDTQKIYVNQKSSYSNTVAESVEEVIFNDLLNDHGESIGLKRGSEIPVMTSEKLTATKFLDGEGIMPTGSSVKAEKQEYITEISVAAITGTPNTTEKKCISSSDIVTRGTPVGLVAQSRDKLCSAGIAVSIAGSEICNQDMEISLVDDAIKGEMKNQPFLSLNKTSSLDDAWAEVASNHNKMVSSGMTYLADIYSSANQTNFAGETSNELKPEKLSDLEESSLTENVNCRSDKIEVKEDKNLPQEDLSSMHLEDTNITAAEPVQEIVALYPLEVCESGDTKESEISLRKEETGSDGSSGIGTVQTESSIETNEMSEVKEDAGLAQEDQSSIHLEDTYITHSQLVQEVVFSDHLNKVCRSGDKKKPEESLKKAELTGTDGSSGKRIVPTESSVENNEMNEASGQKTIMATEWSQYFQGTIYRVETDVSSAGYTKPDQLINEEFVKILENEKTTNTEKELYVSEKNIIGQSSEGKFVANDVFDPLSENNSQCAKDKRLDFSDGSFNNVSGETQEKPCKVLDGEGTDPVSPEEKGICNKKLPYSSCLPALNDTQEKSDAVCMDLKNTRIEIPVNILPQLELEQLDIESETQKQGAESGEVNAGTLTQALPLENLTVESFSMIPLDHALVDGERNASGERVMGRPVSIDFVATMDGSGIIEGGETDGVEEDSIVEEIASALKLELTDYSGGEVDAELYYTNMSDTKTIEVGVEDGEKAIGSHQGSLHGDKQEDISSFSDTPCSTLETSTGSSTLLCSSIPAKQIEEHPQAMDDINHAEGTEISTECKERKHLDESNFFTNTELGLFWGDDDEVKETDAKAEIEHPQAMDDINHAGGTEISTECKERKHLDESNFFTNMELGLFWGDDDEVKETDAKAGGSNEVDKAIAESNSSEFKGSDYVAITDAEDTKFSVPEDTEETMGLREDLAGHDATMEDKSPLLKSSENDRVVDGEAAPAFRTELNVLNGSAKRETSNSVPVKQLISSIMKSKSNSRLIQRTPKRNIFHDMKENEGGSTKRAQIGNRTTPKISSKLRRPLDRI